MELKYNYPDNDSVTLGSGVKKLELLSVWP